MLRPASSELRFRVAALIALFAGFFLDCAHLVAADIVLDQAYDGFANAQANVGTPDRAQTLTVGVTGLLAEVEVNVRRREELDAGDLLFGIWPTIDGVPVEEKSEALASISLPQHRVPTDATWISFDVSPFDIAVEAGDVLAIVLRDPTGDGVGGGTYLWSALAFLDERPGPYPGGQFHCRLGTACDSEIWREQPSVDANFRTFVALPEPGGPARFSASLFTLSLLAMIRHTRS